MDIIFDLDGTLTDLGGDLYPYVMEGLQRLHRAKHRLFIVSNCQSGYIETFLDYTKSHGLFVDIECFGNTGKTKAENIRALMKRNRIVSTVYIGDTKGDQTAAEQAQVSFFFVTYGFGECSAFERKFDSFEALTCYFDPPCNAPDFYREGDAVVFTRDYHLKRGHCCHSSESGCRNCPFRSTSL